MLFGKMQESQKYATIPLDDITPKAMEFLRRLFYGLKPKWKDYRQEIVSIFHFADKYLFKDLRKFCLRICQNKWSANSLDLKLFLELHKRGIRDVKTLDSLRIVTSKECFQIIRGLERPYFEYLLGIIGGLKDALPRKRVSKFLSDLKRLILKWITANREDVLKSQSKDDCFDELWKCTKL